MRDLDEFFDAAMRLPIRGKVYVVQSPDAVTGIRVQRLFSTGVRAFAGDDVSAEDLASLELNDDEERDMYPRVLGAAYGEMVADKVPWEMVKHAGTTILVWIASDRATAERYWSEAPGEARRPEPQDHKAPAKKRTSRKPGTPSGPPEALHDSQSKKPSTNPNPETLSPSPSSSTGD